MKIWCYDDSQGWGRGLLQEAVGRCHDARLFSAAERHLPEEGIAFVHMHHHPEVRARDKQVMAWLSAQAGLRLIPDPRSAVLYDNKLEQARQLARWMPETIIATRPEAVAPAIDTLGLPLISKASEGASAYNVRLIKTRAEAEREAAQAFGNDGLLCKYGQRQKGYLLWQRFLAGNAYDFRVIAIGAERLILRRGNRDDRPMASGSNKEMPITWPDAEASAVLDFSNAMFEAEGFRWCGIDVVKDPDTGQWRLLETTVGWPLKNMPAHRFVSGRPCRDFWPVVMTEIEAGRL